LYDLAPDILNRRFRFEWQSAPFPQCPRAALLDPTPQEALELLFVAGYFMRMLDLAKR